MPPITKTQLDNAATDANTLASVINGSATANGNGIIVSRLGMNIKTLAKVISDLAGTDVSGTMASAIYTEFRSGRVAYVSASQTPSGQPIEVHVIFAICGYNTAGTLTFWRSVAAPANGLETDTIKQDANNRWWNSMTVAELATLKTDFEAGRPYIQYNPNPSNRPIPLTVKGLHCVAAGVVSYWTPTTAPADGLETDTIKLDSNGRWWVRLWISSDTFNAETAFRNTDTTSGIFYSVLTLSNAAPWIGANPDGTMTGALFGSILWPGDDVIIYKTMAGDPVQAFDRSGGLIRKA